MATRKKSKKKAGKSKKTAGKKATPAKAQKPAKKAAAPKKAAAKKKGRTKTVAKKAAAVGSKKTRQGTQRQSSLTFPRDSSEPRSGEQSGDLQGLSDIESVDSESVDELVEEGNAFEAGIVAGVEDSGERGIREVRTREVPEDDVPEEYLDKD